MVLCGHNDVRTAWKCDWAFLLLGLPLPLPQTDPCNTPWAEQLHFHWFLAGICNVLVFNKALGCGLGDYPLLLPDNVFTGCFVILYQRLSWWLRTMCQTMCWTSNSHSLGCWWTMGMVMLAPGIWTVPETGTQASRRGPCLAEATCESVVPRLLCTAGRSRDRQCCLSPGEKEVYWQTENEQVYFLPVLSKNSASVTLTSLAPKCLRHIPLPFKPFKIIAVKAVLAHKSGHAPHLLLSFFLFPLKTPKFICFVASWKLCNTLADLLGFISFSFSLSHHPFSNIFYCDSPAYVTAKHLWPWFSPSKNCRVHFPLQPHSLVRGLVVILKLWVPKNSHCPWAPAVYEE